MKIKFIAIILTMLLTGCISTQKTQTKNTLTILKSDKWETIPLKSVSSESIKISQSLCNRVLNTCNTSSFKAFSVKEATPELIQKMTPEKITNTCKEIIKGYGKFKSTRFIEAQYHEKDNLTLYVFNCEYEKKYYKKVIKIIINENGQATNILTETIQ
jgi:hypothetical protein